MNKWSFLRKHPITLHMWLLLITVFIPGVLQATSSPIQALAQPDTNSSAIQAHSPQKSARVLIINSYHYQYSGTQQMNKGILEHLLPLVKPENIHIEVMDERRFSDDETHRQHLLGFFEYKYTRKYRPDLIIVTDDAALSMLLTQMPWTHNIPSIFIGINVAEMHDLSQHNNITGVFEAHGIEENFQLMQRTLPQLEKIIVVGGQTLLPQSLIKAAKNIAAQPIFANLEFDFLDDYSFDALYDQLRTLPDNTAVLITAIHRDNTGRYFSYDKFIPEMTQISNAPIFGMWEVALSGKGVLGGAMNSAYASGQKAGKMALQILGGEPASNIDIIPKEDYLPIFDYRQMQRFNVPEKQLPQNAKLLFKPNDFYQTNRTAIWISLAISTISIVIISTLLLNINRRIKAEKRVSKVMNSMEKTIKERTQELANKNSKLTELSEEMRRQANSDPLTGIANRRCFTNQLEYEFGNHKHHPDSLSIAIIDIDDFKLINDNFGHLSGDDVLVKLSKLLADNIRPRDLVARWGGEEFILLLPGTSSEQANQLCQRLCKLIENATFPQTGTVTVSIGVDSNLTNDTCVSLVGRIDKHLYESKNRGKNCVTCRLAVG